MTISGSDLAILTARFGSARFGASRFGYTPKRTTDEVGGGFSLGPFVWGRRTYTITVTYTETVCDVDAAGGAVAPEVAEPVFIVGDDTLGFGVATWDEVDLFDQLPDLVPDDPVFTFAAEMSVDEDREVIIVSGPKDYIYSIDADGVTAKLFAIPATQPDQGTCRPVKVGSDVFVHARHSTGHYLLRWDGSAVTVETPYTGASALQPLLVSYGGKLHILLSNAAAWGFEFRLYRRDDPTTFTLLHDFSPSVQGSPIHAGSPESVVVHNGKLWFTALGAGTTEIWSWDGASAVLEHSIADGLGRITVLNLFSKNNRLYYTVEQAPDGFGEWCKIGRYDGATWNDSYKLFRDELDPTDPFLIHSFALVGSDVFAWVEVDGDDHLFRADNPNDIAGEWTDLGAFADIGAKTSFTYTQMVGL